jgi:hypothetical protein
MKSKPGLHFRAGIRGRFGGVGRKYGILGEKFYHMKKRKNS